MLGLSCGAPDRSGFPIPGKQFFDFGDLVIGDALQRECHELCVSGCPSSKQSGLLSLFSNGGPGSSWIDIKPLGADG
jgi:hypothetical protein